MNSFEHIDDWERFAELPNQWDDLVRASLRPTPFLLHGWLTAWWKHHGRGWAPAVEVAWRDGRLVGALPFMVGSKHGLRIARFVGKALLADVLIVPGERPGLADELVQRCSYRGWDFAFLDRLPPASLLAEAVGPRRLSTLPLVGAPVVDIERGWDTVYRERTSAKKRNLHNRRRRQLAQFGVVRIAVARDEEELEPALEAAFELHRLRWSGRPDRSGFSTPSGMAFQRDALHALIPLGVPRIVTLSVNARPIAFLYYLALCGRMYIFRLAFDPRYAKASPGIVTNLAAIEAADAEGISTVEFLDGEDRYKLELADHVDVIKVGVGLDATRRGATAVRAAVTYRELRSQLKSSDRLRGVYSRWIRVRRG